VADAVPACQVDQPAVFGGLFRCACAERIQPLAERRCPPERVDGQVGPDIPSRSAHALDDGDRSRADEQAGGGDGLPDLDVRLREHDAPEHVLDERAAGRQAEQLGVVAARHGRGRF